MSEEYIRFVSEAIFAASVITILFLVYRASTKNDRSGIDADLERIANESLETTRIVANFRIFLMELSGRVGSGEVSTERARELVFKRKASAFDRIHRLVVLSAKKNDNSCGG